MNHKTLVEYYGSASEAARQLGFTRACVSLWKQRGIPKRTQTLIEALSGGKLLSKASKRKQSVAKRSEQQVI